MKTRAVYHGIGGVYSQYQIGVLSEERSTRVGKDGVVSRCRGWTESRRTRQMLVSPLLSETSIGLVACTLAMVGLVSRLRN